VSGLIKAEHFVACRFINIFDDTIFALLFQKYARDHAFFGV
tara:strand:+ start:332 stop:454 length:123 start_codon:yes stop_codon:yes gene_type:complete